MSVTRANVRLWHAIYLTTWLICAVPVAVLWCWLTYFTFVYPEALQLAFDPVLGKEMFPYIVLFIWFGTVFNISSMVWVTIGMYRQSPFCSKKA